MVSKLFCFTLLTQPVSILISGTLRVATCPISRQVAHGRGTSAILYLSLPWQSPHLLCVFKALSAAALFLLPGKQGYNEIIIKSA